MRGGFAVHSAGSVEEAADLIASYGDDARILAGGTELVILLKTGLVSPGHLVDVKHLGLGSIRMEPDRVVVGATVTHGQLQASGDIRKALPTLSLVESQVGNPRVRATGTIGGNLAFAEPSSDVGALLLLFGGRVTVQSRRGRRTVEADDFFVHAFTTAASEDEIVTSIEFDRPRTTALGAYKRIALGERPTATVGCQLLADSDSIVRGARIVVAAANPIPVRIATAESLVIGRELQELTRDTRLLTEIANAAADRCQPTDDVTATASYKRQLVKVLARRALSASALSGGE